MNKSQKTPWKNEKIIIYLIIYLCSFQDMDVEVKSVDEDIGQQQSRFSHFFSAGMESSGQSSSLSPGSLPESAQKLEDIERCARTTPILGKGLGTQCALRRGVTAPVAQLLNARHANLRHLAERGSIPPLSDSNNSLALDHLSGKMSHPRLEHVRAKRGSRLPVCPIGYRPFPACTRVTSVLA